MARGHAERLFPMIDEVLAEADASYADLTRVAVCTGPGSFTGLRVGVAAARGLALGCGIPAIGIALFEAVREHGQTQVALPGRGGEIHVQDFQGEGLPTGDPRIELGEAPKVLADPVRIARLASDRMPGPLPAPVYLRPADAAPSKDVPPPRLP